jgi:Prismane/CO dehydrogenase family
MNPVDPGGREVPPCGYGLLGLCCFDCLRGPCRISPFEKTQALCGAEPDLLVAGNLCRLAAKEFASVLKSLTRAVAEFKKRNESTVSFSIVSTENLAHKYGVPSEELIPFLEKETTKLLDPSADKPTRLFSSLFPERISPPGYSDPHRDPLLGELFGLLDWKDQGEEGPEAFLWRGLDAAASLMIIEELTHDILSLLHSPLSGADQKMDGGNIPQNFPDFPQPVVVSLVEAEHPRSAEIQRMATALRGIPGVFFISLRGTEGLLRFCHGLKKKWHRRIFKLPMVALVESSRVLSILAPLALGLPVVSDPSLPIQGSKKVEDFFYSGLSKGMGNFYLPVKDETALPRLSGVLGRKP